MNLYRYISFVAIAMIAISTLPAEGGIIADANRDFPAGSPNPNGVWTYGYKTSIGGDLTNFKDYFSNANGYGWSANFSLGAPAFFHATNPVNGINSGEIALHGGPRDEFAVLRYTSASTGIFDVLGTWRGPGDIGNTDIYLLINNVTVNSNPSTTTTGLFSQTNIVLNTGDTVDLVLGTGGDTYFYDSTPVNLQILQTPQAVPEPTSLLMYGLGATCFPLFKRWRVVKCFVKRSGD